MPKESKVRIALAQINTTVGDISGNAEKVLTFMERAKSHGADIVAFPELTLTGYPPEDLLYRKQFVIDQRRQLDEIAAKVKGIVCILGFVGSNSEYLFNSAGVLYNGALQSVYNKIHLPNYSVFDEERYFEARPAPVIVHYGDCRIGLSICEDIWVDDSVVDAEALVGKAEILLNISASPYHTEKGIEREILMAKHATKSASYMVYVNLVGGQDELVFDGRSLVIGPDGQIMLSGASFEEDLLIFDLDVNRVREIRSSRIGLDEEAEKLKNKFPLMETYPLKKVGHDTKSTLPARPSSQEDSREAEVYKALCLGLRDYVQKNGFSKVILGLSGGVDSALVAVLAVDALGRDRVGTVSMPSQFSSQGSKDDAKRLAENLGVELLAIPIREVFHKYDEILRPVFKEMPFDITEENLQARIRGNLLMALSNKFGYLVLTTGNKSEVSVGYSTLYGDTVGGFSPLKDVLKTMVYRLCRYRNQLAGFDLIPMSILEKAPSAELKPGQVDQDSLPPYDLLDQILEYYVEKEMNVSEIVSKGFAYDTVMDVARRVDFNEYKRRQAAPGVKITPRAFGKDRRMPITNRYVPH
jgi:NAD+ synthase (glutamine-hydrolysing)